MTSILPFLMLVILFACVATSLHRRDVEQRGSPGQRGHGGAVGHELFRAGRPMARTTGSRRTPTFGTFWRCGGCSRLFLMVFRELTDHVSRVKVRFLKIADRIGSGVFSLWIGWVMVCFTMMTLHTAPLGRNFLWDGFKPEESMMFGMAEPDREWLGFVQKMSMDTFCRMAPIDDKEKYVFDPNGEFMPKYAARRAKIEAHIISTQTLRENAP